MHLICHNLSLSHFKKDIRTFSDRKKKEPHHPYGFLIHVLY